MNVDEQALKAIARKRKIAYLQTLPGMDRVAVTLNADPTYAELEAVREVIELIEDAGFEIKRKE